jgi:hypothetical protein
MAVKSSLCQDIGLGAHGDVILVVPDCSGKWTECHFIWSHVARRPWGMDVGLQCTGCYCLCPWSKPIVNQGVVVISCKFCRKQLTYSKPANLEWEGSMMEVGGGEWYVVHRLV